MNMNITASIRRALRARRGASHHGVHFHAGPGGHPYVCDFHRCDSPGLSAHEVGIRD
jgi:hypothetical protein